MGTDPCHLCATPGAKLVDGYIDCPGCGKTTAMDVVNYLTLRGFDLLTDITFEDASFAYQRGPFATRMSFGEYLVQHKLKLIGKP